MTNRSRLTIDGVFDIETEAWDSFVCGAILTRKGYQHFWYDSEDDMVDRLLRFEGVLWAHNGGKFDVIWFLSHLVKRDISKVRVSLAGQRIVSLKYRELTIRDSAALLPMSLVKAAELGGEQKEKTGLPCECGNACGGYCAIKRSMPAAHRRLLAGYLRQDCVATLSALDALQSFADTHDLDLTGTIGMSAWKCASRELDIPKADWSTTSEYEFSRRAYFGGRCQVFRTQAVAGYRYDINSAYPAALASLSLPTGERTFLASKKASRAFEDGKPGLFSASLEVPKMFIPPIPVRLKDRIAYPYGKVEGVWTSIEIQYALSQGVKLSSIGRAMVWSSEAKILEPFCRRVWGLRDMVGPKTAFGLFLKLYANSLTGKFAQNPEVETIKIDSVNNHFGKGWFPLDIRQTIWACPGYSIAPCAYIEWAAYLTAYTRIKLHEQITGDRLHGQTAVYCDTDSCISIAPRTKSIGLALGEWKYEGTFRDFEARAPKTYAYTDDGGEFFAKAKGIPNASANWQHLRNGVPIDRGVASLRAAARDSSKLFRRKAMVRKVDPDGIHFGDRILGESFLTYPQHISNLVPRE